MAVAYKRHVQASVKAINSKVSVLKESENALQLRLRPSGRGAKEVSSEVGDDEEASCMNAAMVFFLQTQRNDPTRHSTRALSQ